MRRPHWLLTLGLCGGLGASGLGLAGCRHQPIASSYNCAEHAKVAVMPKDPEPSNTAAERSTDPDASKTAEALVPPRNLPPQTQNAAPIGPAPAAPAATRPAVQPQVIRPGVTPGTPTSLPKNAPQFDALPPPIFPGDQAAPMGTKALLYEEITPPRNGQPALAAPQSIGAPAAPQIVRIMPNGDKLIELNSKTTTTTSEGKTTCTLTGEVVQFRHTWRLRYAPLDADDPNGGSVCLEGPGLERLQDGQKVRVTGTQSPGTDRFATPRFEVQSLDILGQ